MREDLGRGFKANLPISASVIAYASVLGVLSARQHVSIPELVAMNCLMFAGSAQFVVVELWRHPLPIIEMVLAVAIINLRYILITASLYPLFAGKSLLTKMALIHMVADENWAVTMAEKRRGSVSVWFLFGGGLCLGLAWNLGTIFGNRIGAVLASPEKYALDFAFFAVFTAFCGQLWQGRASTLPWMVAALLAMLAEFLLPGKWYIMVGGLGGALSAGLLPTRGRLPYV